MQNEFLKTLLKATIIQLLMALFLVMAYHNTNIAFIIMFCLILLSLTILGYIKFRIRLRHLFLAGLPVFIAVFSLYFAIAGTPDIFPGATRFSVSAMTFMYTTFMFVSQLLIFIVIWVIGGIDRVITRISNQ